MNNFLEQLNKGVIVGDGAMGTELVTRSIASNVYCEFGIERLNITNPELVQNLHQDYVLAGSNLIETNTFTASRPALAKYGLEDKIEEIISSGVKLARAAAGSDVYVAGSVGPLPIIDGEEFSNEDKVKFFTEHIGLLISSGVDLIICESFTDADELVKAVTIAKALTQMPVIAQAAFDTNGYTSSGTSARQTARRAHEAGADVVGANCGYGVPSVIAAIELISELELPMSAFMNAGFPEYVDNRVMYRSSPEYLAQRSCELVNMGVRLIGGCCGTTPASIKAIAEAVRRGCKEGVVASSISVKKSGKKTPFMPVCQSLVSSCRVLAELDPPASADMSEIIDSVRAFKKVGVDAITIADNPLASPKVDVLAAAVTVSEKCNIPVLPHLTGRDRNRIALKSTIMGAHTLGFRNILCVTGDPIKLYQQPNTSGIFNVNSVGLVSMVANFNAAEQEENENFEPITIGVAINPNVYTISGQVAKLQKKINAGASFALTQPIYSEEKLNILLEAMEKEDIILPLYVGMMPFSSAKNAEYIHNEIPGIYVPQRLRDYVASFERIEDQQKASIDFCLELVAKIAPQVHGLYLVPQKNSAKLLAPIIDVVKDARPSKKLLSLK